jgi:ABC-type phosphate/phosphonate transport system substrate-binding protein
MIGSDEGLTKTYNRFHSPDEHNPGILELRRLHGEMDIAVLRAYGWHDLADQASQPDFCQFLLDYEEDNDDMASESSTTRRRKKPWRYRWPDDFRDEVLARLLELNEQRYKEEVIAGVAIDGTRKSSDDEDEPSDDEESKPAKPTKPKQPRQSKKTKKPDNPDQPKFEF